jgi:hypothetical protein
LKPITPIAAMVICAAMLASSPAAAQQLGGASDVGISLVRIGAALVVCLAAAAALIFILKRRGGQLPKLFNFSALLKRDGCIYVLEVRRISSYAEVSRIACDGTEYLILTSASGQEIIDRRDREEAPPMGGFAS